MLAAKTPEVDRKRIFIGNLPFSTNLDDLVEFFKVKQEWDSGVIQAEIPVGRSGRSKGYGFLTVPVTMTDTILEFNERELEGRKLKVDIAKQGEHISQSGGKFIDHGQGVYKSRQIRGSFTPSSHGQVKSHDWPAVIDIGANLTHPSLKSNVSNVIKKAKLFGVSNIIVTGTSVRASKEAQKLATEYKGFLYFTAGVHPHDAKHWNDNTLDELETLAKDPACVAIGETGLDFDRNFSPPDVQEQVFEKQIQLAAKLDKPLFVHERKAFDALMTILQKNKDNLPKVVIHCFTGDTKQAKAYLEEGYYIGLTGYLCKDKSPDKVLEVVSSLSIPLDKLMIETDAPFLFPDIRKFRSTKKGKEVYKDDVKTKLDKLQDLLGQFCHGHRNEPCSLGVLNQIIALCLACDPEEVAKTTTQNAISFFGLA
ncbi:3'-5' ssDNA/RNA exonuclease TatD-like [Glandiceps talaboti]